MLKSKIGNKKNNLGFTLVELICAIGILAIISVSIVTFINVSSKSFKESNSDVNLQYEAQSAANQVKDLIINSNRAVHYYTVDSPVAANCFLIVNESPYVEPGETEVKYKYPTVKIWFVPSENVLYYGTNTFTQAQLEGKSSMAALGEEITSGSVLAKNVSAFSVEDGNAKTTGKVKVNLTLSLGDQTYTTNPTVVIRNKVIASANVADIFSESSTPLETGSIKSFDVKYKITGDYDLIPDDPLDKSVGVNKGSTLYFKADVEAVLMSEKVKWSLSGNSSTSTTIESLSGNQCILKIADNESSDLTLNAECADGTTKTICIDVPEVDWSKSYIKDIGLSLVSVYPRGNLIKQTYRFAVSITPDDRGQELTEKGYDVYLYEEGTSPSVPAPELSVVPVSEGGNEYLEVSFTERTSEKTYNLMVTSKAKDVNGNSLSDTNTFTVEKLFEVDDPNVTPSISISVTGKKKIVRNESTTLKCEVAGIINPVIKWNVSNSFGKNITFNDASSLTPTLTIGPEASWTDALIFDVYAEVIGGTAYDGTVYTEDAPLSMQETDRIKFNVGEVKVTLSKEKEDGKFKTSGTSSQNVTISVENLNLEKYSGNVVGEATYYYRNGWNSKEYDNNDGNPFSFSDGGKTLTFYVNNLKNNQPKNLSAYYLLYYVKYSINYNSSNTAVNSVKSNILTFYFTSN